MLHTFETYAGPLYASDIVFIGDTLGYIEYKPSLPHWLAGFRFGSRRGLGCSHDVSTEIWSCWPDDQAHQQEQTQPTQLRMYGCASSSSERKFVIECGFTGCVVIEVQLFRDQNL